MGLNFSDKIIFDEKKEKFSGKSQKERFKLVWQWIKNGDISLNIFNHLIWEAIGEAHAPSVSYPRYDEDGYEAEMIPGSEAFKKLFTIPDEVVWYKREKE